MSDIAIRIENLSKQYRLGLVGTGTLHDDLNRWWHRIRGKEDPYLKVGETNDRSNRGNSDYVWALRDINLEVKQGEVLGIIGKNGAGKSTLLKILSQVTGPTTGSIKAKGRIASLLEVGTGFHPELTGRENIYLNGAILGMAKAEVSRKLDEIVDFAGVERYLDTPVKRYSSGMTVRLGFAVAAFLEEDILIVDEVLAVGDAEFQKKAIGKMQEVSSGGGRTVLFVSHNMDSIQKLCNKGLMLENGQIKKMGSAEKIVTEYLKNFTLTNENYKAPVDFTKEISILKVSFEKLGGEENIFPIDEEINISVKFWQNTSTRDSHLFVKILDSKSRVITIHRNEVSNLKQKNYYLLKITIPSNTFMPGNYNIEVNTFIHNVKFIEKIENAATFSIRDFKSDFFRHQNKNSDHGILFPNFPSTITVTN